MLTVIQNDPEVPCGAYGDYLNGWGVPYRIIRAYAGEILPPSGSCRAVMVLGGAMGVHDIQRHPFLVPLKEWIREVVGREIPYLGICLGGQLLADACGGKVLSPSPWGEKGSLPVLLTEEGTRDPLFDKVPRQFHTFQWHGDSFILPPMATLLASSPVCAHQAFRLGRAAWGTQFHPEMTAALVDLWARWSGETVSMAEDLITAFAAREEEYGLASRQILANFLAIASLV